MDNMPEEVLIAPQPFVAKPTLLTLRRRYGISSQTLTKAAGVSERDSYVMQIGGIVSQEVASNVLRAFSQLAGTRYTLADISASVKPEQQKSTGIQRQREGRMKPSMSHYDTRR